MERHDKKLGVVMRSFNEIPDVAIRTMIEPKIGIKFILPDAQNNATTTMAG